MPAKISTMCYIHEFTKRLTQEFTVKEIMAVARLDDDDPTKIVYLRVKAFIPTPPPLAIMVIPSVRETKASPEYATTPPTISYDEFE
ncbi:unnamed protein product [Rhizophagus irregularis]|nr:unnamed protein product [Rhizophagus irregularis]